MKLRAQLHNGCACYIFVTALSVVSAVSTKSQALSLKQVSTDGPDDFVTSTIVAPISTTQSSAEFSSRQGFQPSVEYARFAEQRSSSPKNNASSKVKFVQEERQKKQHPRSSKHSAAVLKLFDSQNTYNSSSTDQVSKEEPFLKPPRIYYGDVSHSQNSPARDHPQINNIEPEISEQPLRHHENHNYGKYEEETKKGEDENLKYYYPKHLTNKHQDHPTSFQEQVQDSPHHEGGKEFTADHPVEGKVNYGHSHSFGYDHHPEHHHLHYSYPHTFGHSLKYEDPKGHKFEGALGKALHLLIPSALILGGVSALFPNRVHVPTNDIKYQYRNKRSISYQAGSSDPSEFEDIPAKYLKREHRSNTEDDGIEIDLDERENPFLLPPTNLRFRGRNGPRSYNNNPHLTPHQRFELAPPSLKRNPGLLRSRPSVESNSGYPEQYDAFYFNNPGSYNFEVPYPTISPDNEPSPIPPTFPTNPIKPTEEMVPEEEDSQGPSPQPPTNGPLENQNELSTFDENGTPQFVPIPIEEPVLEVAIPDSLTQVDTEITTTASPPTTNRTSDSSGSGSSRSREARKPFLRETINPLQSLEGISVQAAEKKILHKKGGGKKVDLSPDGPVIGLLSSFAQHDKDSPECQKKALCQLALKGAHPVATKFESFLWNLANLVPDQFSQLYDLEEIFHSIRNKKCDTFLCNSPNLDIQE